MTGSNLYTRVTVLAVVGILLSTSAFAASDRLLFAQLGPNAGNGPSYGY